MINTIINNNTRLRSKVDCKLYKNYLFKKYFNLITDNPFDKAVSAISYSEDLSLGKQYNIDTLLTVYVALRINELYGITLDDFLMRPIEEIEVLIDKAQDFREKRDKMLGELKGADMLNDLGFKYEG